VNYRRGMRAACLVLSAALLTGCVTEATTGGSPETSADQSTEVPSTPPVSPEVESPSPQPSDSQAPAPEPAPAAQVCEELMFQRAQSTIRSQQAALSASDFEAARAYASDNFRSGVSVEQFGRIIERNYAFLLDDPELTFVDCSRRGDSAIVRVEVAGSPTMIMLYGMVLENDGWFIDAASVAGTREDVTT
jgi:hypothetical protein